MIAVFTPTYRYGGLDVLEASLARQRSAGPFAWIICDELWEDRRPLHYAMGARIGCSIISMQPPVIQEGNHRNLAEAYNEAIEIALDLEADLFVSLQDYIAVPEWGLARFLGLYEKRPHDLITGLTSISVDPETIDNSVGLYSVFAEPFRDMPQEIGWKDPRGDEIYGLTEGEVIGIHPNHWETNWAAVPTDLFRQGMRWDVAYDRGIAYENMDFARRAMDCGLGSAILLDRKNHAISLPHKDYFHGEREEIVQHTNRDLFESKWGST